MKITLFSLKFFPLFIFLVLMLTACQKSELGKEINFHIGERQKITSNLAFTVDSVWDSRCPVGFECFWSGDVSLFFSISHSHKHIDTMMTCYPGPDVGPLDVAGYKWKIKEVNPYPGTSNTTDPKNITIKIIITED